MDYAKPILADALAAQYVAGVLRAGARRRFESLLPSHPALRAAVVAWGERLIPLTAVVEPLSPPATLWRGIEARLWPASAESAPAEPAAWLRSLPLWRGFSAFATVAALGLGLLLVNPPPGEPPVVVVLQSTAAAGAAGTATAGVNTFVASVSSDGRALVTRPLTPVALQADHVLELWSVPGEGAPRSLGLIDERGVTVVPRGRLPKALLNGGTAALAVSIEPSGGSTTGAPTGPVVFAGALQR